MKLSFNFQDDHHNQNSFLKAKVPISIFNQPFTSIFTTSANSFSDLSFSLSTNFSSGPSLKLTYAPSTSSPVLPFTLSLKSGLGLFGSPHDSPLIFAANFSISNTNSNNTIIPTFCLHFKPQFGHFSLHKRTSPSSNPNPDPDLGPRYASGSNLDTGSPSDSELGNGFASDRSLGWQEVKLEPAISKDYHNEPHNHISGIQLLSERKKGGIFSGVGVKARTVLPLNKKLMVNLRWGVNLPGGGLEAGMPYLTMNKIGIERTEEVKKEVKEDKKESDLGDLVLLKGMCFWMRRDLEVLEKENREMKQSLEDMRFGITRRNLQGESSFAGKKAVPASSGSSGESGMWRRKKNDGQVNVQRELKKPNTQVTDLESELQRAIKAASS